MTYEPVSCIPDYNYDTIPRDTDSDGENKADPVSEEFHSKSDPPAARRRCYLNDLFTLYSMDEEK